MNLLADIRSVFRTTVCIAFGLAALAPTAPAAGPQQASAQLLDHAEFLCANCFFGASKYFYCFEADKKILIGYQKTPVFNFRDESKNYLTAAHPAWAAWLAPGQAVPIRYDEKYIWVTRPEKPPAKGGFGTAVKSAAAWVTRGNGKQVRLTRSPKRDVFANSDSCRGAADANAR